MRPRCLVVHRFLFSGILGNMEMSTYKMTTFFQDNVNQTGWTESWWISAATGAAALTAWGPIPALRAALLMDTCQINNIRAAAVGPPRDSQFYVGTIPVVGTILHATYPACGPWDALLVRRDISTNTLLGHIFMHGIPVGLFNGRVYQNTVAPGIAFNTALAAYGVGLIAAAALCRQFTGGTISYPALTQIAPIRRTEHKVGRPFDGLRGRRAVA